MRSYNDGSQPSFTERIKKLAHDAVAWQLVVSPKFGKRLIAIPLILAIPLTIIFTHFVLIAVLIALIAGYRMSFEKR
jgi:hypothetical protein